MSPSQPSKPPVIESAPANQRQRLLELFPVSLLRERWPGPGTKDELSLRVVKRVATDEIADFVRDYFSCGKQHVYIYKNENDLLSKLKDISLTEGELIREMVTKDTADLLYLVKVTYEVILREPLEAKKLTFLWPVRIQLTAGDLVVRFVVLEKNIPTYFPGRPYNLAGRNVDERVILTDLERSLQTVLQPRDLHKGLKHLWKGDKIDSSSAGFKKPRTTAFEAMDEGHIKANNPDLYNSIINSELFKTIFEVRSTDWPSIARFQVEPSKGILNFLTYSEIPGDVDSFVGEILRHNK